MKTLTIDCATEGCSTALFDGDSLLAGEFRMLGRGHAEQLVPMIAALPGRGRADRICVSLGPGSFTGVRIGLAAARALGLAWKVPVLGYPTLALVAAIARADAAPQPQPVTICMTGGHGEWFLQDFSADGLPEGPLESLRPEAAAARGGHALVAGTQAEPLVAARGHGTALQLWPDARRFPLLPPSLLTAALTPLYGRAPDAKLPGVSA
ncbi:tRNA (adenosine(37)-N6)-threonylcarbamoyltransferase complex dimerization subunit type 1 TsaB [Altererythrobacter sp. CC-YST694]|uniref:tRNA (adenosine(37)-N6)-threonylcarbamoyltransferase complex dimerization subunit type 1 TsaB n=1 Tax=Altererythrobacter sp. CC-YST694 TaxID=2755038 RepID=UPI001D01D0C0|nr:tRNA (adenosine(37)-N6)-threonylcarbamoyltransferase complex dimerization subunit type 1 TsaB [Altererythrobacter sp. CC-YST694]MCB5424065.1 tRNA (adenosine(37)-N6)-threonylcarbamoyltransferase complex dimerization subunit type 1 TsaB [Altererythrobacter sp. CC-YST694]